MEYANYVKKIDTPENFNAPLELRYDDMIAKPLTRADLAADIVAVNSSLEVIRKTRGGSWSAEPVSEEFDLLDLAWHERELREASSFAYVVYDDSYQYIGCFYLYGMGYRSQLNEDLSDYQVDASWWVTKDAYNNGYYLKLEAALQDWLKTDFGFTKVYFSNSEQ